MAEPFVFHFDRDERGFPTLMTVADVKGECGLCKHDEIQRFYRAAPFHPMTLGGLHRLAAEVPSWAGYECANCGSEVGPQNVVASTLVWGFADDSGLVRIYGTGDSQRVELVPERRLDPQELPGFDPPDSRFVFDEVDDATIEAELGRPFNLKIAIRQFVEEVIADDEHGLWAPLGRHMWIVNGGLSDLPDDAFVDGADKLELVELDVLAAPAELPTLTDPVAVPGRVETWLGDQIPSSIRLIVDLAAIRASLVRAFEVARLAFDAEDAAIRNIQTPMEQTYPHELSYLAIARRAAYTGIAPGEAARLTAEEVVGPLLNLKRSNSKQRR